MVKVAIWVWVLILAAVLGYAAVQDNTKKQEPAKYISFEEYCAENKLECSIQGTGSTLTHTVVKPWFQVKGEHSNFMFGWEMSRSSSQGNSGDYASTSTVTGFPTLSFTWNVAETFRNLDRKE